MEVCGVSPWWTDGRLEDAERAEVKLQEGPQIANKPPTHTSAMASTSPDQRKRLKEAPTKKPACLPRNAPMKIATAETGFTYARGKAQFLPAAPKALKTSAVGTKLVTGGFLAQNG